MPCHAFERPACQPVSAIASLRQVEHKTRGRTCKRIALVRHNTFPICRRPSQGSVLLKKQWVLWNRIKTIDQRATVRTRRRVQVALLAGALERRWVDQADAVIYGQGEARDLEVRGCTGSGREKGLVSLGFVRKYVIVKPAQSICCVCGIGGTIFQDQQVGKGEFPITSTHLPRY